MSEKTSKVVRIIIRILFAVLKVFGGSKKPPKDTETKDTETTDTETNNKSNN